jgi:hypothetical protein
MPAWVASPLRLPSPARYDSTNRSLNSALNRRQALATKPSGGELPEGQISGPKLSSPWGSLQGSGEFQMSSDTPADPGAAGGSSGAVGRPVVGRVPGRRVHRRLFAAPGLTPAAVDSERRYASAPRSPERIACQTSCESSEPTCVPRSPSKRSCVARPKASAGTSCEARQNGL